ncbi:hypothetical protein F5I97DRAFT_1817098 [Phlebopus sp. FC_14]|nr:hypothetical protein F5I97DRAFT_1817098 [Phlebopus sp. FC_14]
MESWKGFLRSGLQLRATDSNASHNRIFRIPVFAKLNQITELQGDELCDAWLQCIFCHYRLWKKGVRHRDVSCGNLMYYRCSNQVKSVLNDFDLASMDGVESRGHQRTGTPPFMATDLLINSQTKHLYRHDLESFIWVWVWLTLQFKDGELRSGQRPLDAWAQCSARQCAAEKKLFLSMVETYADDQINEEHWKLVMELCCKLESPLNNIAGLRKQLHLARQYHKQDEKKIKGQLAEAEDDGNFFRWFLEVLRFSDQPQFTPPSL